MELISWWWAIGLALFLFLCSMILFKKEREDIGGPLMFSPFFILFLGIFFIDMHNTLFRERVEARNAFVLIQQDWKIKEIIDEPSKPTDPKFDPSQNIYIVERVQNGCLMRAKIVPRTGMKVVDVEVVGPVSLVGNQIESKRTTEMGSVEK